MIVHFVQELGFVLLSERQYTDMNRLVTKTTSFYKEMK